MSLVRTGRRSRAAGLGEAVLELAEAVAKPSQDGLHGVDMSQVVQLVGVVALVEEFLGSISPVANIGEIPLGQGKQRTPMRGRSTLIGLEGIGALKLSDR